MDARITKQNGESFTFSEHGITIRDFIVSSIPLLSGYSTVEGSHRRIDEGAVYGTRTITLPNFFEAQDMLDYPLLRDFLFSLVLDTKSFYIQEMRRGTYNGNDNQLIGGKRYLVRLENIFDLEQQFLYGFGSLIFETTELPFAESIGTTQDIQLNGIAEQHELWPAGMGIIPNMESYLYTHETNTFRIYNAGNVPIHPFEQELKITISDVVAAGNFELKNSTNNTAFQINETVNNSQEIVLDGPNITSNGLQYLRKTNKQFIELEPGWNEFQISGATSAKVSFDFRFYYL